MSVENQERVLTGLAERVGAGPANLLVWGSPGTGKTHLICRASKAAHINIRGNYGLYN